VRWFSGHVVNELFHEGKEVTAAVLDKRAALLEQVLAKVKPRGSLLILEPALRDTSRALLQLLRESNDDKAVRCAERCRRAVDGFEFQFNGTPIKVTISLGVATLFDTDFAQPEDLIAAADKYLYRAKRNGRNRVDALQISGA
jgi:predicted signal transduction protein with EAL and GGDEF domain